MAFYLIVDCSSLIARTDEIVETQNGTQKVIMILIQFVTVIVPKKCDPRD